jgi:flavodoxin
MIRKIVGIYYSPAGGTAKMAEMLTEDIALRLRENCPEEIETLCCDIEDASDLPELGSETVAVLAMPVYMGKIPLPGIKAMRDLSGGSAMTLALVSYSGRTFGNALYELKEYASDRGFEPIGAGAFAISYGAVRGSSRPGSVAMDIDALSDFGKASAAKIMRLGGCDIDGLKVKPAPLNVKGNMPKHGISMLSPKAAAIAQSLMDMITFHRKESEWFL